MSKNKPVGICNICEYSRVLSDDHVPPKICKNVGEKKYNRFFEGKIGMNNFEKRKNPYIFQNGVYFTSICEKCNNELGHFYDSALGNFTNKIIDIINKNTNITEIKADVEINKLTRAVIGHMLSAYNGHNTGKQEKKLRDYFDFKDMKKINGLYLYLWFSPFDNVLIGRNFGIHGKTYLSEAMISVIKFKPVGFMLSDKMIEDNMLDLFSFTSDKIDDVISLTLFTNSIKGLYGDIRGENWPFQVNDDYVFITTKETYNSTITLKKQ